METERICPNCRKPLPPDVPLGLCPECLIKSGFPTEAEPGTGGIGRFVPPPVEEIARLFPQFEILGFIGKGGMGAVYKARQPGLDRLIALKVLPPSVGSDPGFAERFNREARALARLSHPNIVVVYDFGKAGELHYLVMEFVDGTNLRDVEKAGRLSSDQALAIVPQICEALQFAHNEGIVHRDIKPENLLLDKKGRVKITDFGIAKILNVPAGKAALTGAKDVVGTPHYMAPEQIEKPQTVDHRADIYSLGVVFYEMLTGELPLGKFAPPSKKVQVDVRLDEVVLHTLEKEPDRRYQQVSEVKTDVETIAGTPPTARAANAPGAPPMIPASAPASVSEKILLPTFLLAFFFGVFGAHRFYVGKIGTAILQLCTLGGLGIWTAIDWILILCKVFTDGKGRRITNWWHPSGSAPKAVKPPRPPRPQTPPIITSNLFGQTFGGGSPMIVAPAVALMVSGFLKVFGAFLVLLIGWPETGVGHFLLSRIGMFAPFHYGPFFGAATILFSLVPAVVMIYGAMEMIRCGNYPWATAAAVAAIIFCSTLGFPAGIWALIVLLLPSVRDKFENPPAVLAAEKWAQILGGTAAAGFLLFLMICLFGYLETPSHRTTVRLPEVITAGPVAPAPPAMATPAAMPAMPALPDLPTLQQASAQPSATPLPAPTPPTDNRRQTLQTQLYEAQRNLTNMEARYSIGTATSAGVDSAKDNVEILQGELADANLQAAKIELAVAQHELEQKTQLRDIGRASADDIVNAEAALNEAELQLEKAEAVARAADPQGIIIGDTSFPAPITSGTAPSYQLDSNNSTKPPQAVLTTRLFGGPTPAGTVATPMTGPPVAPIPDPGPAGIPAVVAPVSGGAVVNVEITNAVSNTGNPRVLLHKTINVRDATDLSQSFDVAPGGKLTMNVDRGAVRITGTDENSVTIHVTREVTGASDSEAAQILNHEHMVLTQDGNEISITARTPPELQHLSLFKHPNLNAQYEITLPRGFDTHAETSGGDINLSDIQGSADIRTMGGSLVCGEIDGDVSARTMGGDVRLDGCKGSLDLQTMGGSVIIKEFSGPGVQATTSGGSVSADFAVAPTKNSELQTMGGNITVRLPDNAALQLEGQTFGGSERSDFPVEIKDRFGNGALNGAINGGGPVLRMQTDGGNVDVIKN